MNSRAPLDWHWTEGRYASRAREALEDWELSGGHASPEKARMREGEVYEGHVSISGGEGPQRRWLVVAPGGKAHIHSIDNPADLHCWPLHVVRQGLADGRMAYVDFQPHHPVLQLQRAKEARGLRDCHLGLRGAAVESMVVILEEAVAGGLPYAPYAAGEILALLDRSRYSPSEVGRLVARVEELLARCRPDRPEGIA